MKNTKKRRIKASAVIIRIAVCVLTALFLAASLIFSGVAVINYGPSKTARDLFVISMLETSAAKFLATWYFSPAEIESIVEENAVVAEQGSTDPSLIKINTNPDTETEFETLPSLIDDETDENVTEATEETEEITYATETDPEDEKHSGALSVKGDGLEIYDVSGPSYSGKMMVVHDPSRLFVGVCGDYTKEGVTGKTLSSMAKSYNATAGINGGGFRDDGGLGNGGTPIGLVITKGKLVFGELDKKYEIIGFNKNNVFIVGTMTGQQALDAGIRDALSFSPILVMNGRASSVSGTGGGLNPRTAIGQRADGAVLLLVIDGRQPASLGATYADLIDVMLEYGAVNAANLDGGNSSGMYYDGSIVNRGLLTRGLPTCFLVK
jgi:exopolysaccharide biosynthesis protein